MLAVLYFIITLRMLSEGIVLRLEATSRLQYLSITHAHTYTWLACH